MQAMAGAPEPRWAPLWQQQTAGLSEVSTWPDACAPKLTRTRTQLPLSYSEFDSISNSSAKRKEETFPFFFLFFKRMMQEESQTYATNTYIVIWLHSVISYNCNIQNIYVWRCELLYRDAFYDSGWKDLRRSFEMCLRAHAYNVRACDAFLFSQHKCSAFVLELI